MILPVALISACFLITASLGSEDSCYLTEEEEDQCASVCYPIVKPLLRYFEKSNERNEQLLKCRADYTELQKDGLEKYSQISKSIQNCSELVKSHLEVLSQLSDEKVKNAQLHSKQQEVDNLINQKNKEIDLLKDQIRNLKKTSKLATLTNQFSEDIDKLRKILKIRGSVENNPTNSEVETGEVPTTPQPHINNQTPKTQPIDFPDPCPRNQKELLVFREIQLPGSDPFKSVCYSDSDIGSGWLYVYKKMYTSQTFNRTYEDYERGFGDVGTEFENEFFIGLNRLHHLTSGKPHEVLLFIYPQPIKCNNFIVADRSEGYKLKSIRNCIGYDWTIPKQGSKFSTFDRDEDGVPYRNLAKEYGYGWWFDPGMRCVF
ncbi:fibroleukin-like [Drosophila bipectinata]|uniref:fibroleukin-like n=1 Tax=Drosophila bipectinata TaxID=42026 RepID=UPI0038B2FA65